MSKDKGLREEFAAAVSAIDFSMEVKMRMFDAFLRIVRSRHTIISDYRLKEALEKAAEAEETARVLYDKVQEAKDALKNAPYSCYEGYDPFSWDEVEEDLRKI